MYKWASSAMDEEGHAITGARIRNSLAGKLTIAGIAGNP